MGAIESYNELKLADNFQQQNATQKNSKESLDIKRR